MKENYAENNREKIPTKDEVLEVVSWFAEKTIFVRELSDEKGLYLLEVQTEIDEAGENTMYQYVRKVSSAEPLREIVTSICAVYYQDGMPTGGDTVAIYNSQRKTWEKGSKSL